LNGLLIINHSLSGTVSNGKTSLDHFMYKKNILLCIKQFRLVLPFKNRAKYVRYSNVSGFWMFTVVSIQLADYSTPPKAGLPGFQMVISRTFFVSNFRMLFGRHFVFFTTESQTGLFSSASLDRFVTNKIFFMTLINKTV
jgi:hypothetical protein